MSTVVAAAPQPTLWSSIREAIRGSHQDFTAGSLNRAILLLAVPMVLEMVLESLFAVVDVFWVGRVSSNAVATVGLTEKDGGTLLSYNVEAQIGGKLAQLGQRLINGSAKKLADEFFANFAKAVQG